MDYKVGLSVTTGLKYNPDLKKKKKKKSACLEFDSSDVFLNELGQGQTKDRGSCEILQKHLFGTSNRRTGSLVTCDVTIGTDRFVKHWIA